MDPQTFCCGTLDLRSAHDVLTKAFEIRIDEVTEEFVGLFNRSNKIEWWDPWLIGLIGFHIVITLMTLMTRDYGNFQVVLFLILLSLVYFSESINEIAAKNWSLFSRQQYFDSKGMFISLVFSVPILLNCMIMVANWLWQSSQLMLRVKQVQLRHQVESNNKQQKQNKGVKCQSQKPRLKSE